MSEEMVTQAARDILAAVIRQLGPEYKSWADAVSDPTDVILEADIIALRAVGMALSQAALPKAPDGDALREAVSEKTRKWLADNMLAAQRLMKSSSKAGNGYDNFSAHYAYDALKELSAALQTQPAANADLVETGQFLLDRLADLEWCDLEATTRDWYVHVEPALARFRAALSAMPSPAREGGLIECAAVVDWAVERWRSEVEHRPLVNIHRRSLDDAWRQVIRQFGGDPDALLGPDHDTRAQISEEEKR